MGNKSKKKKKIEKELPIAPPLNDEQKRQAVQRLVGLFRSVSQKPEPILDMLFRLEIPWYRRELDGEECIVIKAADLERGEERHQEQGSIADRIYKDAATSRYGVTNNPIADIIRNGGLNLDTASAESAGDESETVVGQANSEEEQSNDDWDQEAILKGVQG